MADNKTYEEARVWVFPDGATSWIGGFEIPAWSLRCDLYAFSAEGENEAVFAIHRIIKGNAEWLRRLGPGQLNWIVPSDPQFIPRDSLEVRHLAVGHD